MKILVASDIHGSFTALQKFIAIFNEKKADLIILCGDYLNHGPRNNIPSGYDTKQTAALLNTYKSKIISVRGNCDSEVDQMLLELPVRSESAQMIISGSETFSQTEFSQNDKPSGRIFIHHGHLFAEEQAKTLLPKGTLIISGHTHIPVLKNNDGYIFMNPSSISIPKTDDGPCYGEIETNNKGINRISIFTLDGHEIKSLEWSDLYTAEGIPTNKTKLRQADDDSASFHLVSEILTIDNQNKILVTKRSSNKDTYPNFWEITGGSCLSGENPLSGAVREMQEETGVSITEQSLKPAGKALTAHTICNLFVNKLSISNKDVQVTLQQDETVDYKWLTKDEFVELYNSEEFCPAIKKRYSSNELLKAIEQ